MFLWRAVNKWKDLFFFCIFSQFKRTLNVCVLPHFSVDVFIFIKIDNKILKDNKLM